MMCGGWSQVKPATVQEQNVADMVKVAVTETMQESRKTSAASWAQFPATVETFTDFKVIEYRGQVVAGTNYLFKIQVAEDAFIAAKVFKPLPCVKSPPEVKFVVPCEMSQVLDPDMGLS